MLKFNFPFININVTKVSKIKKIIKKLKKDKKLSIKGRVDLKCQKAVNNKLTMMKKKLLNL